MLTFITTKKALTIISIALFILLLAQYEKVLAADESETSTAWSLYSCHFPVMVELDGNFSDWPASVHWRDVTHDMGWDIPDDDEDGSLEFACVADEEYLYVAVKIWDDEKVIDEDVGNDVYMDDSLEIYIDGDNSKSEDYEADVSQITIGRYNAEGKPTQPKLNSWRGMNEAGKAASETETMAAVVDTDYGWAVEVAIPLDAFGIKLENGKTIGFNVKLNDDDDGGNMDHTLGWSKVERLGNNASFRNPSVFGELKFVSIENLREKREMKMGKQNVIEGVDRLQWGKGQESTYIGALTAAMRAIGKDVTYDYLMGVSGAAFRLHFQWCPSSPDATCGFDCSAPALKALGYTAYAIHSDKNKPEEVKKVREAVVKNIDKGYPVLAIDLINVPDWGVIVGYSDGGKKFLCRTYYDKAEEYSKAEKWPWVIEIIDKKVDAPEHKESILKSLEIAVKLSNTKNYGDYASGFAAYETWAQELLDDAKFANLDEEELNSKNHTNAWCYSSLIDAREAAVRYLKSIGKEFDAESAKHLSAAMNVYEEILGKLKEGWKYAPFPWQLQEGESWTKEMRHSEAEVLKEVLTMEKKAIAEIEKALAAEGVKVSAAEQSVEKKIVLDGVDRYRVIEPMFEGIRVILSHRGEKYSPAYIQGISGAAFRIAGICPCAPTCSFAMEPQDLIELLGYEVEYLPLSGEGIEPEKRVYELVKRVKDEIRAGRPVLVWHAFTNAEWDVVCGFDDEKQQFLGRGSYAGNEQEYAVADETRTAKCGHICDPLGVIIVGEKTGEFDERKAELVALREAVSHAHSRKNADKLGGDEWVFLEGFLAYDRWIDDFKNNPEKKRGSGDAYCYGIYKSTHQAASEFLKEIAPKYPEATKHLELAAKHFAAEVDVLGQGADLLWWQSPEGPDLERNAKAAELLSKARENYASGVEEIEFALKSVNANGYGFRYDPMKWAESDETLQGAMVRTLVLEQPRGGDQDLIDETMEKIPVEQNDDGSFGNEGKATAEKICGLLELGCPTDKCRSLPPWVGETGFPKERASPDFPTQNLPEVQRATNALVRLIQEKKTVSRVFDAGEELPMGLDDVRALCLVGKTDLPELHTTLRWYADNVDKWINRGCPWGQSQIMVALSTGRQVVDVEAGLTQALTWAADNINGAGCLSYFDPWSFVRLAGMVEHPLSQTIVEKQLTLILRSQNPDGGWSMPEWWPTSQSSFNAFRALAKHGFLETLRQRPPLPPGWKIAQSIPAPEGDLWGLAWDGEFWWMCDDETNYAIAVSPKNGEVVKKVKLPEGNGRGFGWWDGALAVNQGCPWEKDPKRLVKIDPETGRILREFSLDFLNHIGGVAQMDKKVLVVDSFFGWLDCLDADGKVTRSHISLAGPLPVAIAPDGEALWHDDLWVPFFIKSGLDHDGQYLDFIEKPFKEPYARKPYGGVVRGMGYDGENLWILDNKEKRICLMEKTGY